jgi:hypothetical protein
MFRSLSPWSVFTDSKQQPVLCDFSECLVEMATAPRPLEKHCGSSQFCAPECHVSTDYTAAADVYSFGMITWSMCECDERPFGPVSSVLIPAMVSIQGRRPPFDRTPAALRRLISDCWGADPLCRPTFSDVIQQLRQLDPSAVDLHLDTISRAAMVTRTPPPVLVDIKATLEAMRFGSRDAIATTQLPANGTGVTLERFDTWYASVLPKLESGVCGEVVLGIQRLVNRDKRFLQRLGRCHFFSLPVLLSDGYAKFSFSFLVHIFCNMPECVSMEMRPWIAANIARDPDSLCILFGYFLTEFVSHQTAELAIEVVLGFAPSFVNSPNARALLIAAYQLTVRFPHLRVQFGRELANFFLSFISSTDISLLRTAYSILLNVTPDPHYRVPFDVVVPHLDIPELQWTIVPLFLRVDLDVTNDFVFGALLGAAELSLLGFLGLCRFADTSADAYRMFLKFPAWLTTPMPTFSETYRLLVLLAIRPPFREAVCNLPGFGMLLYELVRACDVDSILTMASLIKRCNLNAAAFASLDNSGFIREVVDLGRRAQDDSLGIGILVIISTLMAFEFSQAYVDFIPTLVDNIEKQGQLAAPSIHVLVQMSPFRDAGMALRQAKLDLYFTMLLGVAGFEAMAASFLANLEGPSR